MIRIRLAAAAFLAAALAALALAGPASATTTTPGPSFETCANLAGWTVNGGETDRRPTATVDGLKFEGNDLIHHATTTTVEELAHGTFALATGSAAPDQDSFFSVEVFGSDGGYGTLRWNTTTSKWNLTTGGQFYENASAAALVDMPPVHRSHKVVSFGVGYTANPPGTVATTVKSVTFGGKTYDLTCAPVVETTSPAPHQSSTSPAPHQSSSTPKPHTSTSSAPVAAGPSLPVTGPPVGLFVGGGLALLVLGAGLYFVARRRKVTFEH